MLLLAERAEIHEAVGKIGVKPHRARHLHLQLPLLRLPALHPTGSSFVLLEEVLAMTILLNALLQLQLQHTTTVVA